MITVTSPLLPDFEEFTALAREIWSSRRLTNQGEFHKRFEEALCRYLDVPYISIFTNGTIPLLASLKALEITGEVITTPYSFVATSHAMKWCGLTPVFADADPRTGNLDPQSVERLISDKTTAILPVHVYGNPCDTEAIKRIAEHHGLKVIYDAAHAFGVRRSGRSILSEGDLSTLSFHATKVFNTLEGGAVVCPTAAMKHKLDNLKNFGIRGELCVEEVGINGKMDELRAAFGLLNLRCVDAAIAARKERSELYRRLLGNASRVAFTERDTATEHNYSHFPVLFSDREERDRVYGLLLDHGYHARRYFYPLITDSAPYDTCRGADATPNARHISDRVLCLPLYHDLQLKDIEKICTLINNC